VIRPLPLSLPAIVSLALSLPLNRIVVKVVSVGVHLHIVPLSSILLRIHVVRGTSRINQRSKSIGAPDGRSHTQAPRIVKQFGRLRGRRMSAKIALSRRMEPEWSNNSDDCEGGWTVHQDRALPENRTLHPKADRNSRFQTLHIAELVTFRRLTLPEIPSSLLLMCQACEKFLGTTNTVLCYRQTRRSLRKCLKQRLVNMFVAQEASFISKFTNYPG